jgi:transposase-like protein
MLLPSDRWIWSFFILSKRKGLPSFLIEVRVEVITGPERRRRWSVEQNRAIVAESLTPGAVVAEIARRADICPGWIYRWRREIRVGSGFAPVLDYSVDPGSISPAARPAIAPGYQVPLAAAVKEASGIVVQAVGMIVDPRQAEAIVADGHADCVALARGFLDDPRWAWHGGRAMTTNITADHRAAIEALTSGDYANFALFSCLVNGEPATATVVINRDGDGYAITPLFVSVTPSLALAYHDGQPSKALP